MPSFDPFADFAQFPKEAAPFQPPAPALPPQEPTEKKPVMNVNQTAMNNQPMMQQQQPAMQQNPYGMNYGAAQPSMTQQPIVPAPQQNNQWSMQQQQATGIGMPMQQPPAPVAPVQSYNTYSPAAQTMPHGYPQQQQQMNSAQSTSPGYMTSPTVAPAPLAPVPQQHYGQQPVPVQQQQMTTSQSPVPVQRHLAAPSAVVQEDDDFFGAFSNVSVQEGSPSRPPSVFEARENDDISYLSKSTGGGTQSGYKNGPLDDPKFAPKPPPVHGLAQAQSLSAHAPPGASKLPNFDEVTHSGYVLSRISFRTILIKKWKQTFWVTYGKNQVLFFRSSADFEDWISNPYLSQGQRDFLVKLRVNFVEDLYKQNVRGYQVTNMRLKNYNNKMLHQFKLERWMDYGPTIAAAFASPNEREVFNLRTLISEMMKRTPQGQQEGPPGAVAQHTDSYDQRPGTSHDNYGAPDPLAFATGASGQRQQPSARNFASSSSVGRLDYGRGAGASIHSHRSHRSTGVLSTGPVERSRDPVNEYAAGYRVQSQVGGNGRY